MNLRTQSKEQEMPSGTQVRSFIAAVVGGDHVGAIRGYYHDDATMQENNQPPRCGIDTLMVHEEKALARLKTMHTHPPKALVVDGDQVVIHWVFDATDEADVTRRLEELSFQQWRGDRIQTERFFYDTASAWNVVKASDPA
jgi:ketosteroid isomerase-like protein